MQLGCVRLHRSMSHSNGIQSVGRHWSVLDGTRSVFMQLGLLDTMTQILLECQMPLKCVNTKNKIKLDQLSLLISCLIPLN